MNLKIHNYDKYGYLILKNVIDKKLLTELRQIIKKNFYFTSKFKKNNFHKDLIKYRMLNKKNFGYFFDTLQTTSINYKILTQSKILSIVNKLLRNTMKCISLTDVSLRIDPPNDNRNSLKWHQDSSYFRQNKNAKNGTVVWLPVFTVNSKTGTIEILEKSYEIGPQNIKRKKSKKNLSSQRDINQKLLKGFKKVHFNLIKPGDAIFMNMDMVHRSSINVGKVNRVSLVGRYHNTISGDYNSGLNIFKYSDSKLNKEVHG